MDHVALVAHGSNKLEDTVHIYTLYNIDKQEVYHSAPPIRFNTRLPYPREHRSTAEQRERRHVPHKTNYRLVLLTY